VTSSAHIVLLLLLVPACAETVAPPPSAPVNWASLQAPHTTAPIRLTDKERAVTDGYVKALRSPDFGQLGPLLSEVARFSSGTTETHGRERVVAAHQALLGAYDAKTLAVGRVWLTNDDKAIEWTMGGVAALTILETDDDALICDVHVYFADTPAAERGVFVKRGGAMEKEAIALLRGLVQALEDDKEAQFVAPFAGAGQEEARAWFKTMRQSVAQLDTAITSVWAVEDQAVVEYAVSGRHGDAIVRKSLVDIAEIHDGRITRIWRYGK
jgi:hypothetical protein